MKLLYIISKRSLITPLKGSISEIYSLDFIDSYKLIFEGLKKKLKIEYFRLLLDQNIMNNETFNNPGIFKFGQES